MKAENLPFADNEFDMATAIEVLEHVPDPEAHPSPRCRAAPRAGSSSRSPASRSGARLNMGRGAYWKTWATRPGHLNHWSSGSFKKLLSQLRRGRRAASPFPWTMCLVRVAS